MELRGHGGRRQSQNDVWELNPCPREVEALLVRKASLTRMGISMAAFPENFIETSVVGVGCGLDFTACCV